MNCGPDDADCTEALMRVYEYLDSEMGPADLERIRTHVTGCTPCLREYGIEEEVKALVHRSHRCDQAPGSLRERILATLRGNGVWGVGLTSSRGLEGPTLGGVGPMAGGAGLGGPGAGF